MIFDAQLFILGGSLLTLILINILLGSINAIIQKEYDGVKLRQGFLKGIIVCISFVGCYFVGLLNPDLLVLNIEGQEITLLTGINIILVGGYVFYGKDILEKLAGFVGVKIGGSGK